MLSLFISCESSAGGLLNVSPMRPRMTLPNHDLSSWRFLEFRIAKRPLNAPICPENQRKLWSIFLLVWHLDSVFSFFLFTLFNTFFSTITSSYYFCLRLNIDFCTRYLLRPWFKRCNLFLLVYMRLLRKLWAISLSYQLRQNCVIDL